MSRRTAVVVGGGIGGLAAAIGLAASDWRVTVLERAPDLDQIGAGLALTANGLAAAGVLGIRGRIVDAGERTRLLGCRDEHDEWIYRLPYSRVSVAIGIGRPQLHAVLRDAARHSDIRFGARVVEVEPGEPGGPRAWVHYEQEGIRHRLRADLVVGADGLRSTVRDQVLPGSTVRYSGRTCWRGITELADVDQQVTFWWGPHGEAGVMPLGAGRHYWYAYRSAPEGDRCPDERGAALRHFDDWPTRFVRFVEACEPDDVLRHDVYRLRWSRSTRLYSTGRVVLIGDAAHAMLPTMGQGANSALEDAVSLAPTLSGDLAVGLRRYGKLRLARTGRMTAESELMDRLVTGLRPAAARRARNAIFRRTPPRLLARSGEWLTRWTPPL